MSESDIPTAATGSDMIGRPGQYRHDPSRIPALGQVLDMAGTDAADPHEAALAVSGALSTIDAQAGEPTAAALFHTLMYVIEVAPAGEVPPRDRTPEFHAARAMGGR